MRAGRDHRAFDPVAVAGSAVGLAGLIWLGPLMLDQLVFFADQDQTRQAEAARELMLPAAAILLAGSAILLVRASAWHALLSAAPALVAVPLALLAPEAAYQLVAYGITAPVAFGSLLAASVPLPRAMPTAILFIGAAVLIALALLGTPFIALLTLAALVVWWRLPGWTDPDRR